MTDEHTDLKTELLKMAKAIVTEANAAATAGGPPVPFAEKVDALSELTKLYIAFKKHPGEEDEDDNGFTFERGVQASPEKPNGAAANVHTRRRPSGGPPAGSA